MSLPPELWQMIVDQVDFLSKIRLRQVHPYLMVCLQITDFYNIDDRYLEALDDAIIKQHPYIKELFAFDNPKITDVTPLINLEILDASWGCGIGDNGLKTSNLKFLDASGNTNIKDISHMTLLKELYARWGCGIKDNGLPYQTNTPAEFCFKIDCLGNYKIHV